MKQIWAVVVTHNPSPQDLLMLLNALVGQVDRIVVVDNASDLDIRQLASKVTTEKIELVVMPENLGLAAAQNIGLRMTQASAVPYAILFDQDSIPDPDMVGILLNSLIELRSAGERIAAVGPNYLGTGQSPFRRLGGLAIRRCSCSSNRDLVPVDFLISSGCLISLEALPEVGEMNEHLFIDYIDVEWGLRAARHGFRMVGVCAATMKHRIGDGVFAVLGKVAPMHSPLRHYYLFRNGVWLFSQNATPFRWKLAGMVNLFCKFWFYLFFSSPRTGHFRMMILGIIHGVIGKLGRLS